MARVSLSMTAFAVCCASCLVTSVPDFGEPEQTPPELIVASATPDPRNVIYLDANSAKETFSALVRSTVDDGQPLSLKLYLDYGVENVRGQPYRRREADDDIPEATSPGGDRLARATWFLGSGPLEDGCHTITMMVSHSFDNASGCPERLEDSDSITWFVSYCASGACENAAPCPVATAACPVDADAVDEGGGGGAP